MARSLSHLTDGLADPTITQKAFTRLPELDDGPAAIVGGGLIDAASERQLRFEFRHLSEDRLRRLFTYPEPLSSLSAKIRMAHALGHLKDEEFRDCEKINKIRNAFAHSLLEISFDHQDIKAVVDSFETVKSFAFMAQVRLFGPRPTGTKGSFVETCQLLFSALWILRKKEFLSGALYSPEIKPSPDKYWTSNSPDHRTEDRNDEKPEGPPEPTQE